MATVKLSEEELADRHRNRMARRSRDAHAAASDIGTIPLPVDLERRRRCERDLHRFLVEYFPESTGLSPFGEAQIRAIKRIERCILAGGRFLNLFPRGFSKSTISENAIIWCVCYGHRNYAVFFGAKRDDASGAIESIKKELSENELLEADFPEITQPCIALEGKYQRCGSQLQSPGNIEGSPIEPQEARLTHIEWTSDTLVIPTVLVPGGWGEVPPENLDWDILSPSKGSGAIVRTRGLMSAVRGLRYKKPDGKQIRPDFCIIDDPQTEESAESVVQIEKRLRVIRRSILRLGGHGKQTSVVINATIMSDGDIPDTLSDPEKHPEWEVERIRMMLKMPSDEVIEKYWMGEYARLRRDYDRGKPGDRERAVIASTEYYKANRKVMDDCGVAAWPDIPLELHEISAIQHAMNIMIDDGEDVFASECQNEPKRLTTAGMALLPEKDLREKTSGIERGVVPESASHITFHIDVHDGVLYWAIAATSDDLTGGVIDYGTWPDQPSGMFTLKSAKRTLQMLYAGGDGVSTEQAIKQGVLDCINRIAARQWVTPAGVQIPLSRGLVDMGYKPEHVAAAIRESGLNGIVNGSTGVGFRPGQIQMHEYDTSPARMRRSGPDPRAPRWYVPAGNTYGISIVRFDSNFWKETLHARFATKAGTAGSWDIFGSSSRSDHSLYVSHLVAESPVPMTDSGRTVNVWKPRPGRENHWLDATVGALVAASYDGCKIPGYTVQEVRKIERKTMAQMRAETLAKKRGSSKV